MSISLYTPLIKGAYIYIYIHLFWETLSFFIWFSFIRWFRIFFNVETNKRNSDNRMVITRNKRWKRRGVGDGRKEEGEALAVVTFMCKPYKLPPITWCHVFILQRKLVGVDWIAYGEIWRQFRVATTRLIVEKSKKMVAVFVCSHCIL